MAIAIFFVIALISAAFIAYPLLPGREPVEGYAAVTDSEIEQAVRKLRDSSAGAGPSCPTCGRAFKAGDSFCVGCGSALPTAEQSGRLCPSCGATLREGDHFCAKCGHRLAAEEVA